MKTKSTSLDIRDQLRKIVGIDKIPMAIIGEVVSVDNDEMTCEVEPVSGASNFKDVRICVDNTSTSLYFKPSVGSLVIIAPQSEHSYYVSMFSSVDEIWLRGDQYGGLVKVSDLVGKLNNLENDINDLKTVFSTWVTVPNDGGAALKAGAATWYASQLTPTQISDIENEDIKHG